jgi:hypothetical protein
MNWQSILTSILANAIFIAAATAVVGYFFNKKLEEIKKETAVYLLKYQTLHTKRAEAIEGIYTSLEKSIRYMADVMNPLQLVDDNEYERRVDEAQHIAQDFKELYSAKRIYLQPSLAKQLDKIDKRMLTLWFEFTHNHPKLNPDSNLDIRKWDRAWEAFSGKEIPAMLKRLEKDFRILLGSDLS